MFQEMKRKPYASQPNPFEVAPIAQPMAEPMLTPDANFGAMPQMQAPKRGMFAGGGKNAILNAIADFGLNFSAGMGNQAAMHRLQASERRRQMGQQQAMEAEQYERQREDKYADWVRQQTFKMANPDAPPPTEFERLASSVYQPGTPEYQALVKQYVERRANPPQYQFIPNVGLVQVPSQGAAPAAAPQGITFTPLDDDDGGQPVAPAGGFR